MHDVSRLYIDRMQDFKGKLPVGSQIRPVRWSGESLEMVAAELEQETDLVSASLVTVTPSVQAVWNCFTFAFA